MEKQNYSYKTYASIVDFACGNARYVATKYMKPDSLTKKKLEKSGGKWDFLWVADYIISMKDFLHWFYPFTEEEGYAIAIAFATTCLGECQEVPPQCCDGSVIEGEPAVELGSDAWIDRLHDAIWDTFGKFVEIEEEGGDM